MSRTRSQSENCWRAVQDPVKDKVFTLNELKTGNTIEKNTFLGFTISGRELSPMIALSIESVKTILHKMLRKLNSFVDWPTSAAGSSRISIVPTSYRRKRSEAKFQWIEKCHRAFERLKS